MQKIKAKKDFENVIKDNPIKLLKALRLEVHNYQDTRYDMVIALSAIKDFINLKQHEDKSLVDYKERFVTARNLHKGKVNEDFGLTQLVKKDTQCTAMLLSREEDKLHKRTNERFIAYLFLKCPHD